MKRIPGLDGVRGLAALTVVWVHAVPSLGPDWLGSGAVDVFFVLSAFLLSGVLLDTVGEPRWVRRFFVRRIARIMPLYLAVLVLLSLTDRVSGWTTVVPWLPLVTFTYNVTPWLLHCSVWDRRPVVVLWSISFEEQMYVALALAIRWVRPRALPAALFLAAGVAIFLRPRLGGPATEVRDHATFARLDGIAFGVLGAIAFRREIFRAVKPLPWILGLLAMVPYPSAAAALFVLALARGQLPLFAAALSTRPLEWLGRISFGCYVLHMFMIERFLTFMNLGAGLFLAVLPPTLILAHASAVYFEEPIRRRAASRSLFPGGQSAMDLS